MLTIPKTKTNIEQRQAPDYIYNLAIQIKEDIENEDILFLIDSALSQSEKELLKQKLITLKLEVKTPADYFVNRKIYRTIAIIMDKSWTKNKQDKQIKQWLKNILYFNN